MKNLFLILIFFLLTGFSLNAADRYVITDCYHFERKGQAFASYYPDYFSDDPEFASQIIEKAKELVEENFGAENPTFLMEKADFRYVDEYAYGSYLTPRPTSGLDTIDRNMGDKFISIYSTISHYRKTDSTTGYILQMRVLTEDKKGKKVRFQKIKVRFYPQGGDSFYGTLVISREDFKKLYFMALEAGLSKEKAKVRGDRSVSYGGSFAYSDFRDASEQITLVQRGGGQFLKGSYFLQHGGQEIFVMGLNLGLTRKEGSERYLGLDLTDEINQKGTLTIALTKKVYNLRAWSYMCSFYPEGGLKPFSSKPNPGFPRSELIVDSVSFKTDYDNEYKLRKVFMNDSLAFMYQIKHISGLDETKEFIYNCWVRNDLTEEDFGNCLLSLVGLHVWESVRVEKEKILESERAEGN